MRAQFQKTIKFVLFILIFAGFQLQANAAGILDPTFGTNGRITINVGNSAEAKAVAVQPDGKIIVVGDVSGNGRREIAVVRFNSNGSPDVGFGSGGKILTAISSFNNVANAVAIQPDGKIVVVGSAQPFEFASGDFLVVRYNANGSLDSSFGTNGSVMINQSTQDSFNALAIQPDGKIIAVGSTSQNDGEAALLRFNSNGTLDTSFGDGGLVYQNLPPLSNEKFQAVALFPDGRIAVGGIAVSNSVGVAEVLALFEPNGALAQNFGNQGVVVELTPDLSGFDLAVTPDGKILTSNSLASRRFLSNGTPDAAFRSVGYSPGFSGGGSDLALLSNGSFVVAREFYTGYDTVAAVYSKDGRLIGVSNRLVNFGTNYYAKDVAVQPDDKIIILNAESPFATDRTAFRLTRLLAFTSNGTGAANFDADEKADIAVLRHSNSTLYVLNSIENSFTAFPTGEASLEVRRVIPGRYKNSLRFVYWKTNGNLEGSKGFFVSNRNDERQLFQWGQLGDVPVDGDYDGDDITDFTVFRPSDGTWYVSQSSNNQPLAIRWGISEDKPVPADYDYDGITDAAVFRPSTGFWYVRRSSDGGLTAQKFGAAGDIPLTGDYDGDGRADFVVYRPSEGTWYLLQTTAGFRAERFGLENDSPVPGDYDGDGRHDIAVFRQGNWYILGSTRGFYGVQWGAPNDVPVAVRYAY